MWVEVRDRSELRSGSIVDLRVVDLLVVDVKLDMEELATIGLSVIGTLSDTNSLRTKPLMATGRVHIASVKRWVSKAVMALRG